MAIAILGASVSDEQLGDYAKLSGEAGFLCLERKGSETYPSKDKAVRFFEVPDLEVAITSIGHDNIVQKEPSWAVLHDPEGHNALLLQAGSVRQPWSLCPSGWQCATFAEARR